MDRSSSSSRPAGHPSEGERDARPALRLARCDIDTALRPAGPADLLKDGRPYERTLEQAEDASAVQPPPVTLRIDSFAAIAASLDAETRCMFEEAVQILRSLRLDREAVEAKLRELGREDPIRTVTGASALDQAIVETEDLIRRIGGMPPAGE